MIRRNLYFLFLSLAVFLTAMAGYSDQPQSADYSQAVSLFETKNYQAALPLFQQVVQDDPNNAMAHYYLGSCQETAGYLRGEVLNYYVSNKLSPNPDMKAYADKQFAKLSPEDQDWVEKHQDSFSQPASPTLTTTPAATPASAGSSGHLSEGIALFDAGDFTTALPLLQQAAQENRTNAKAYYYLGKCEKMLGNTREAVLYFYFSDLLEPYPALKTYADQQMAKLSPGEQKSVNDQLENWKTPQPNPEASIPAATQVLENRSRFGVRLSAGMAFFNLEDFQQDMAFRQIEVEQLQTAYPNTGTSLQTFSGVPTTDLTFELNPYVKLDPNIEVGLSFVDWPSTSVQYSITSSEFPQYLVHSEWDISSLEFLLKGRFYIPTSSAKDIRLYAEPFAGLQPIYLHFAYSYTGTSGTPSADQASADYSAMALVGGLKLGLSFYTSSNSCFSIAGSYQWASASNFQGNFNDNYFSNADGHGSLHMYNIPNTNENYIFYIPDNPNQLSAFNETPDTINNSTPFKVDLSGFHLETDFTVSF